MLPLDLHVLSLWLAFILSQDQTLRCNLYLYLFLAELTSYLLQAVLSKTFLFLRPAGLKAARDASLASCHCPLSLFPSGKRVQRYANLPSQSKYFTNYFYEKF